MKIAFATLGCKVNQFDTAIMSESVAQDEHEVVSYEDRADLYVINTCTVTENADQASRQWVKKALERNPAAKIVMTGCYAQTNPDEVKSIPGIHLVLGNGEKQNLSNLISLVSASPEPISCVGEISREKYFQQPLLETFLDKTRAFLKVQDGCNSWCSFCIIPKARGRSRSFPIEEVVNQVRHFESIGYHEVVLSGINLGTYGLDFYPKSSLLELFRRMEKETASIRFRFSSIEPDLLSDDLIDTLTGSSRVCRHFHIPLQSGDSHILKRMNRKYTPEHYRKKIERIHQQMPEASIGADVMVGFPGETETAFRNTCELISDLPLSYLHVFPYSAREGTNAFSFFDRVPSFAIKKRAREMRRLGKQKGDQFRSNFIGKVLDVLVEGYHLADSEGIVRGLTDNYLKIIIENGSSLLPNSFVNVVPYAIQDELLLGRKVSL